MQRKNDMLANLATRKGGDNHMKIPRNSKCPCGSGLMFKECCGSGNPITGNSLSFISPDKANPNEFEKTIKEYTGHYPDDYINPISGLAPIFYILIDESRLHNYYAVSGIVIKKDEVESKMSIYSNLNKLAEDYYVDGFHFTDIFGRKRVLKDKTDNFIDRYSQIVNKLEMYPFSICKTKEEVEKLQNNSGMSDEQVFIFLQQQLMYKILKFMLWNYGINLIIHIRREQENITIEKRLLHQQNIRILLSIFPHANISIYRHYEIFMKKEILFSSLSDLVAYFTTKIQSRNSYVPQSKIIQNNYKIIRLISKVFKEYRFIDVDNLNDIIAEVRKRENYIINKASSNLS
jgi:hypothetical protein